MYLSYLRHIKKYGEEDTTIDRIDNNGNYRKENCRWATMKEQCNNRSSNILITFKGKTQNLMQWSKEIDVNFHTLSYRLNIAQWSLKKALKSTK